MKVRNMLGIGLWLLATALVWAAPKDASAKEEFTWQVDQEVPESPGKDFTLPTGERCYVAIENNQLKLIFFEAKEADDEHPARPRVSIAPPYKKVILRGDEARNKTNQFFWALEGSTDVLTFPRQLYPPHDYFVTLVVPREGKDALVAPRTRFTQD